MTEDQLLLHIQQQDPKFFDQLQTIKQKEPGFFSFIINLILGSLISNITLEDPYIGAILGSALTLYQKYRYFKKYKNLLQSYQQPSTITTDPFLYHVKQAEVLNPTKISKVPYLSSLFLAPAMLAGVSHGQTNKSTWSRSLPLVALYGAAAQPATLAATSILFKDKYPAKIWKLSPLVGAVAALLAYSLGRGVVNLDDYLTKYHNKQQLQQQ